MQQRVEDRVQESAEQVLARLERYVEARRAQSAPIVRPSTVAPAARPGNDTLIPSHETAPTRRHRFVAEIAPALLAVAMCSFVILLSEIFDPMVAVVLGSALVLVGVVGMVRRIPLAWAFVFGLLVAVVLIRFS